MHFEEKQWVDVKYKGIWYQGVISSVLVDTEECIVTLGKLWGVKMNIFSDDLRDLYTVTTKWRVPEKIEVGSFFDVFVPVNKTWTTGYVVFIDPEDGRTFVAYKHTVSNKYQVDAYDLSKLEENIAPFMTFSYLAQKQQNNWGSNNLLSLTSEMV
jgi:hypothetical protein